MIILRFVLFFIALMIVFKDMDSMRQSWCLYLSKGKTFRLFDFIFFNCYSIARFVVLNQGGTLLAMFCIDVSLFRSPLDLCMNFAALGFVLEIDDVFA